MQKRNSALFSTLNYRLPDRFPVSASLEMRMPQAGRYLRIPHVHNVLEIGCCHEGRGMFSIADKILPFRAGDVAVINQHEPHYASNSRGVTSVWSWIFFDAPRLLAGWGVSPALLDTNRFCGRGFVNVLSAPSHEGVASVVRQIIEELKGRRAEHEDAVRGLLVALLAELHRLRGLAELPPGPVETRRELMHRLSPAIQIIQSRCSEPLSVGELARGCAMSPRYLCRNFRRMFGRSPYQYLQEYRLSMACSELEATDWTVEAVAEKYGFPTLSCFVRAFKKLHGVPPRRWARGERKAGRLARKTGSSALPS
jgi:AraC-like DNA-binding protein